ncbi:zinc finger, CCHC-type containing protein [Tanacetum coccineum]
MGDENPIRTIGDYSKPSHEGYKNTIQLPVGNNVVPLQSDTIRLVQNRCSFHGLRSEDPNQHLKDFLKPMDSLDLDGSITTWEDLTTRFLAQFFPPGRTAKLRNDILMFQQHHGESLSEAWTRFNSILNRSFNNRPQNFNNQSNLEGLVYEFMASQDARLFKFEADFKQQQSEMTNKIDTVLKAITDRIAGALPSDTVKNPKLSTTLAHFKEATIYQTSLWQPKIKTEPQQPEEPEPTLEDEFQDLHLNLPVLEVLAHAPIYNAILD